MTEYKVNWRQCPHNQHEGRILFVEAENPDTARAIARDHIERRYGIGWFNIYQVDPYTRPTGGRVVPSSEDSV